LLLRTISSAVEHVMDIIDLQKPAYNPEGSFDSFESGCIVWDNVGRSKAWPVGCLVCESGGGKACDSIVGPFK